MGYLYCCCRWTEEKLRSLCLDSVFWPCFYFVLICFVFVFVFLSSWRKLIDKILQERLPSMSVVLVGDCCQAGATLSFQNGLKHWGRGSSRSFLRRWQRCKTTMTEGRALASVRRKSEREVMSCLKAGDKYVSKLGQRNHTLPLLI